MRALTFQPVSCELGNAVLGDQRLSRRLGQVADAIAVNPSASLPRACRTTAALEAAYRLLSNPRVQPEKILEPHIAATLARAIGTEPIVVVHDTTEFAFNGETRGHLGRTNSSKPGFFAHVSMGIRLSQHEPLGVLGCRTWARHSEPSSRQQRSTTAWRSRDDKESHRWGAAIDDIEDRIQGAAPIVHVVDREGDQYRLMHKIAERNSTFVVRSARDRIAAEGGTLWGTVSRARTVFTRDVHIARRKPRYLRASHGSRDQREATLSVSATTIKITRTRGPENRGTPASLQINAVRVFEAAPPRDAEPIEWVLLTNLPIETKEQLAFVVDCYRARWMIEELFKALKTGCAYEKLQLENELALQNALAIMLPIAAQMLLLRALARSNEPTAAARVLNGAQLAVLANSPWTKLPSNPTARDALRAVATLGGHIKNNGEPGWQVLYAGFRDLLLLELGWRARSDQ